jgi:hypothetical protein
LVIAQLVQQIPSIQLRQLTVSYQEARRLLSTDPECRLAIIYLNSPDSWTKCYDQAGKLVSTPGLVIGNQYIGHAR